MDFFEVKASTTRTVAQLSYKMGTPVLPLFSYPSKKGTYKIKYGPELEFKKSKDRDKVVLEWTQEMETFIESVICKNPIPWMCGHRRWKTRPPEEKAPPIY